MKNNLENQHVEMLRVRTPEVIAEEILMEKLKSLGKVEKDENGKFSFVLLTVTKEARPAKKAAPKKKVAAVKKVKPKKGVALFEGKPQEELLNALPESTKRALMTALIGEPGSGGIILAILKKGEEKGKGEEVKVVVEKKEQTPEELFMALPDVIKRAIIASFNKEAGVMTKADLLTTLPGAIVPIIPAAALGKLNCAELCTRSATVTGNVAEITAYSSCLPTNADVIAIANALRPISERGLNLTNENKILKKILFPQLRFYLGAMITSCANLSYGNLVLFAGTGVPVKRAGVKHNTKLPAPQKASVNTKLGRGILGFECEVIAFAKNYCFAYGDPETDPDTWLVVVGPRNMKLVGLEPGTEYGWQMAAIGKNGVGYFSNTVVSVVPYS